MSPKPSSGVVGEQLLFAWVDCSVEQIAIGVCLFWGCVVWLPGSGLIDLTVTDTLYQGRFWRWGLLVLTARMGGVVIRSLQSRYAISPVSLGMGNELRDEIGPTVTSCAVSLLHSPASSKLAIYQQTTSGTYHGYRSG